VNELTLPVPVVNWVSPEAAEPSDLADYVAPRIESLFSAEQIEREIAYAGAYTPGPWTNIPD